MTKGFTQPDWLMSAAREAPDTPALITDARTWTYADLSAYVGMAAASLEAAGVRPGDRVGVLLPNCPEYAVLTWAIWRAGATVVPLNTRLTPDELAYQVRMAGCTVVLVEASRPGEIFAAVEGAGARWHTIEPPQDEAQRGDWLDFGSLPNAQPHDFERWAGGEFTRQNIAAVLFTSGTSGRPKGAQLTFNNLYYAAMASTLRLGNVPGDRWLLTLPLYHVGGLSMLVRACLCRVPVIVLDRFTPETLMEAINRHRATLVSLVPTMLFRVLSSQFTVHGSQNSVRSAEYKAQSDSDSSRISHHTSLGTQNPEPLFPPFVRMVLIGGAAADAGLLAEAARRGVPVATTYGLTEAGSQVCTALPDEARAKPGTVGRPLPFMRVRIVDATGRDLPPGEIGEIVVQGPNMMYGYVGEPAPQIALTQWGTPERLPYQDGFATGDLGYVDADGDLFVATRRSDLIVSGGENVYPAEVEAVLRAHPQVAEVCVLGLEDAEWGQVVAAAVVLREEAKLQRQGAEGTENTEEGLEPQRHKGRIERELEMFARTRLAGYKLPRRWRVVEALPLTATGKVDRAAARAFFEAEDDT